MKHKIDIPISEFPIVCSTEMAEKTADFKENIYNNLQYPQIPNSSYMLSTPSDLSEAPDIRNWFSSYVYESPVLGTEDELKCLVSDKCEFRNPSHDSEEQNQLGNEINNSSCSPSEPSDLSQPPDIRNWFSSYVYESPVLDTEDEFKCSIPGNSETERGQPGKQIQLETEDNSLVKRQATAKICSNKNNGGKLKEICDPAPLEDDIALRRNISNSIHRVEHEDDNEGKSCVEESDCNSNADSERVTKSPIKSPLSSIRGDGYKVNESTSNGFISTKKNDQKRSKFSHENHAEYIKEVNLKLPSNVTHKAMRRRPLQETTNLQYEVAMPETTGKWRCPQRRKPDLGPPLKQLRLEQWVRRVQ